MHYQKLQQRTRLITFTPHKIHIFIVVHMISLVKDYLIKKSKTCDDGDCVSVILGANKS